MRPEEFAHYVDTQLRNAIPREVLVKNLLASGWTQPQIDEALAHHDKLRRREQSVILQPVHGGILWFIFLLVLITAYFVFKSNNWMFY